MVVISWQSYPDDQIMTIISWWSCLVIIYHFGVILESLWGDFWSILGSCWPPKSSWKLFESLVRGGSRFSGFDAAHFGRFWRAFGKVFGDILPSFVDINFTMNFYTILRWFLDGFENVFGSGFWKVLECFWEGFWRYFAIFCWYKLHKGFLYDFNMIFDGFVCHLDQQKWDFT